VGLHNSTTKSYPNRWIYIAQSWSTSFNPFDDWAENLLSRLHVILETGLTKVKVFTHVNITYRCE